MRNSVIFDLDGTLWEVIESTHKSANHIVNKYNLKEINKDTICKGFGLNKEESANLYFPNIELDKSTKLIDEIAVTNIDNLKNNGENVYRGVKEVLNKLVEKYDLYIVSNTSEIEYIRAFLKSADAKELFKDYIAASSLNISKTDAIKKIIEDNKIESAVYIGDTIIDLESAKNNKIPFVYAKYGFGKDLNAKYSIDNIKDLPNILKKVFNDKEVV